MITAQIEVRRIVIYPFKFFGMENIVDSQQAFKVPERIHVPMSASLESVLKIVTFHGTVCVGRWERVKVTANQYRVGGGAD